MSARILILSAPFGHGHDQAARSIAEACRSERPDAAIQVLSVDNLPLRVSVRGYLQLIRIRPSAYRSLYHQPVRHSFDLMIRAALGAAVKRAIASLDPTIVVATHPFPGRVAAHLHATGALKAPVLMAVTDFAPHAMWIHPGVSGYAVPTWGAKQQLMVNGIDERQVSVTGIPIRSAFQSSTGDATRPAAASRPHRILIMGGGLGLGPVVEAVRSFAILQTQQLQVRVVAGANEELRTELLDLFAGDPRIEVIGYSREIHRFMREADLLVTKPGGISCSEALAVGLPMLLLDPLPGHEEENAAHLLEIGAAEAVAATAAGVRALELFTSVPQRMAAMRANAVRCGRPHAARQVLFTALDLGAAAATTTARPALAQSAVQ